MKILERFTPLTPGKARLYQEAPASEFSPEECKNCDGTGEIEVTKDHPRDPDAFWRLIECPACCGQGEVLVHETDLEEDE